MFHSNITKLTNHVTFRSWKTADCFRGGFDLSHHTTIPPYQTTCHTTPAYHTTYYTTPHTTVLHHTTPRLGPRPKDLLEFILHGTIMWCGMVWHGGMWCGVACGVVWWYGGMACGVVWCGMVWCDKSNPILKQSAAFQDRETTCLFEFWFWLVRKVWFLWKIVPKWQIYVNLSHSSHPFLPYWYGRKLDFIWFWWTCMIFIDF